MVEPADVPRVLSDAGRLLREGELVVFGSAALALRLKHAPHMRDVDVWCEPPGRGDLLAAPMGELSWYREKHDAYLEVWGPETFAAPSDWRARAQRLTHEDSPGVTLVVPHPHDILIAKLERWEPQDRTHARLVLAELPMGAAALEALAARCPHRDGRVAEAERLLRFEAHLAELRAMIS